MVRKPSVCIFILVSWILTGCSLSSKEQPAPTFEPDQTLIGVNPAPPENPVKLIFIHHSTGGNWLADSQQNPQGGDLGKALMENNYFVSATNYGWGPDQIGDRTDLGNWWEWFRGPDSEIYLQALYRENGKNIGDFGDYPRLASEPEGENEIILFKSCYPNSALYGSPDDPTPAIEDNPLRGQFAGDPAYTVANARGIYLDLLAYFQTQPDKLFVAITAPPLARESTNSQEAAKARAFNTWLVNEWLEDYPLSNVAVFDYYNVLTGPENHQRISDGAIEHIISADNFSFYPTSGDDSHPNKDGNQKATQEFIQNINVFYNRWMENR